VDSIRIGFDPTGNVLDVEAEQRLYSKRQREVLALKFGGCMDPNCDRSPSWSEAHHILHWVRDKGKTVIDNGILLCKLHHLKYHNEGYEIQRDTLGNYWQIPPKTIDTEQKPIPMPPKSNTTAQLRQGRTAS
jgi:HNH endonuclease